MPTGSFSPNMLTETATTIISIEEQHFCCYNYCRTTLDPTSSVGGLVDAIKVLMASFVSFKDFGWIWLATLDGLSLWRQTTRLRAAPQNTKMKHLKMWQVLYHNCFWAFRFQKIHRPSLDLIQFRLLLFQEVNSKWHPIYHLVNYYVLNKWIHTYIFHELKGR